MLRATVATAVLNIAAIYFAALVNATQIPGLELLSCVELLCTLLSTMRRKLPAAN